MLAGASTGISIVQCGSSAACTTAAGPDATIDTHDDTIARTRNTDICAAARQPRPAFAVFIGKSQPAPAGSLEPGAAVCTDWHARRRYGSPKCYRRGPT